MPVAANNRVQVSDAAATYYAGGAGYTAAGNLAIRTDAPDSGSSFNGGIAFKAGRVHTTPTKDGGDVHLGGVRVSDTGAVVIVDGAPSGYVNGTPVDGDGALAVEMV